MRTDISANSSFSAEWVLGGSLGRTWGCLWDLRCFLLGPGGVLGAAWGSLDTLGVLGRSWGLLARLLGIPGGSFGSPRQDLVPHMLRTPMFQRFFLTKLCLYGSYTFA